MTTTTVPITLHDLSNQISRNEIALILLITLDTIVVVFLSLMFFLLNRMRTSR